MTKLRCTRYKQCYGVNGRMSFRDIYSDLGFSCQNKKKTFKSLFQFKYSTDLSLTRKNARKVKEKIISHYNALGYRDAQMCRDTQYYAANGNLNVI